MVETTPDGRCPGCGAAVQGDLRSCPHCGTRLILEETRELPADPVAPEPDLAASNVAFAQTIHQAHRRPFGAHPVPLLGGLGLVALVIAIVVLATVSVVAGVILLGVAAASLTLFVGAVRREPEAPTARFSRRLVSRLRSLARRWAVTIRARTRAARELVRLRRRRARLRRSIENHMAPLGKAIYDGDQLRAEALKQQARALEHELNQTVRDASAAAAAARREIEQERAAAEPTQTLLIEHARQEPAITPAASGDSGRLMHREGAGAARKTARRARTGS